MSDHKHLEVKVFGGEDIREERSYGVEYVNIANFGIKNLGNTEPGAEF